LAHNALLTSYTVNAPRFTRIQAQGRFGIASALSMAAAAHPLPAGWSEHVDEQGITYYYNATIPVSVRKRPGGPLPPGWQEHVCKDHTELYYFNSVTRKTQWERPKVSNVDPATRQEFLQTVQEAMMSIEGDYNLLLKNALHGQDKLSAARAKYKQLLKLFHPDKRDEALEEEAGGRATCEDVYRRIQKAWESAEMAMRNGGITTTSASSNTWQTPAHMSHPASSSSNPWQAHHPPQPKTRTAAPSRAQQLPRGWVELYCPPNHEHAGKVYYHNTRLNETRWTLPTEADESTSAVPPCPRELLVLKPNGLPSKPLDIRQLLAEAQLARAAERNAGSGGAEPVANQEPELEPGAVSTPPQDESCDRSSNQTVPEQGNADTADEQPAERNLVNEHSSRSANLQPPAGTGDAPGLEVWDMDWANLPGAQNRACSTPASAAPPAMESTLGQTAAPGESEAALAERLQREEREAQEKAAAIAPPATQQRAESALPPARQQWAEFKEPGTGRRWFFNLQTEEHFFEDQARNHGWQQYQDGESGPRWWWHEASQRHFYPKPGADGV